VLRLRHIPNVICVIRIVLVGPTVWALLSARYPEAMALVTIAGLSDGLDGFLAKRYHWRTRLGGLLDPLADKLLLVSLFLALAYLGLIPWWLAAVVLARDLVIVSGGMTYSLLVGPVQPEPSMASKLNTLIQLVFILIVIIRQMFTAFPEALITAAGAGVFVTSVVSGLDYVIRWGGRAAGNRA
jgi:cardiolipin synthase